MLVFVISGAFCLPLAADDLLQEGHWKGKYTPVKFGADIDATFCVQPDNGSSPPWHVAMTLNLPPPGNRPVKFEFEEAEEGTLAFKIDLLGVLRACHFRDNIGDELIFRCEFVNIEYDGTEKLTVRREIPQPDDACQSQNTVEPE